MGGGTEGQNSEGIGAQEHKMERHMEEICTVGEDLNNVEMLVKIVDELWERIWERKGQGMWDL